MSRQTDLRKLLDLYSRRLQKLKEQEAIKGIDTPPQTLLEIEDLQAKIEILQEMADGVNSDSLPPPLPSIDIEQELARFQPPEPPASPPSPHHFDMRSTHIKAGIVNQGGEQSFHAPLNIDLSEPTTASEKRDTRKMKGQSPGNSASLKARLTQVIQAMGALPVGQPEKDHLITLLAAFKQRLGQLPATQAKEAEKIVRRIEALAEELNTPEPDKEIIEMTAHSLERAAKIIPGASSLVLQIAVQMVRLAG